MSEQIGRTKEPNYKLILQCVMGHLEQLSTQREGNKKEIQNALKQERDYIATFVEPLK